MDEGTWFVQRHCVVNGTIRGKIATDGYGL
jgi:hypothetical protein